MMVRKGRPWSTVFVQIRARTLNLALHRYLWKYIIVVAQGHDQDDLLPEALTSIDWTYLSYQVAQYLC